MVDQQGEYINDTAYYAPSNTILLSISAASGTPVNDTAYSMPSNTNNHVTTSGTPVNDTAYSVPSNTKLLSASATSETLVTDNTSQTFSFVHGLPHFVSSPKFTASTKSDENENLNENANLAKMTPPVKTLLDTTCTNSNKCLHATFIALASEINEPGSTENSTYRHSSKTDSDEDTASVGLSQLDETDVLNFVDTTSFDNEDSDDFNKFDDVEEHLKYIGHLDI
eukprot:13236639-Ditylum_brightwellii.AAC.1